MTFPAFVAPGVKSNDPPARADGQPSRMKLPAEIDVTWTDFVVVRSARSLSYRSFVLAIHAAVKGSP